MKGLMQDVPLTVEMVLRRARRSRDSASSPATASARSPATRTATSS
jgi:hypothetical protein